MKKLELIVPHERLVEINRLLHKHGVGGMTFYDVKGRGRMKREPVQVGRGSARYVPEFGSWTKVEVLLQDSEAKAVVDGIMKVMDAGSASQGKLIVLDVIEARDIGTTLADDEAISI